MTRYNPIADAREDGTERPTVQDLIDQGYDDFDLDGSEDAGNVAANIASAVNRMGGLRGDDTDKWAAVNALLSTLRMLENIAGVEIVVSVEERTETVDPEEEWGRGGEPLEVTYEEVGVELRDG